MGSYHNNVPVGAVTETIYGAKSEQLLNHFQPLQNRNRPQAAASLRWAGHEALLANGSTHKFIASRCETTEVNFSNWLKKNGLDRKAQAAAAA